MKDKGHRTTDIKGTESKREKEREREREREREKDKQINQVLQII